MTDQKKIGRLVRDKFKKNNPNKEVTQVSTGDFSAYIRMRLLEIGRDAGKAKDKRTLMFALAEMLELIATLVKEENINPKHLQTLGSQLNIFEGSYIERYVVWDTVFDADSWRWGTLNFSIEEDVEEEGNQ